MPNALMVCFYFPPIGGPGTQRSAKFVKYLPGCGWEPSVIAAEFDGEHQDPTLLADIQPPTLVRRIPCPRNVWRRSRAWLMGRRFLGLGLGRLATWGGYFMDFPDTMRGWSRQAVLVGHELHMKHQHDVLFTTSYPYSSHTAGMELKRCLGIPWVADLRDPWAENEIMLGHLPGWMRGRHQRAEAALAKSADRITFAHPGHAERFAERHPVARGKCVAITNGFDQDDYRGFPETPPCADGVVRIAHVGSFYGEYTPRPLFDALRAHWKGLPDGVAGVRLSFIGGVGDMRPPEIDGVSIAVRPRVSHEEALRAQADAHVLLCVFDRHLGTTCIPGKLFEYLASGRPIIGITKPLIFVPTSSGVGG